jgi:hypothetical protein
LGANDTTCVDRCRCQVDLPLSPCCRATSRRRYPRRATARRPRAGAQSAAGPHGYWRRHPAGDRQHHRPGTASRFRTARASSAIRSIWASGRWRAFRIPAICASVVALCSTAFRRPAASSPERQQEGAQQGQSARARPGRRVVSALGDQHISLPLGGPYAPRAIIIASSPQAHTEVSPKTRCIIVTYVYKRLYYGTTPLIAFANFVLIVMASRSVEGADTGPRAYGLHLICRDIACRPRGERQNVGKVHGPSHNSCSHRPPRRSMARS